MVKSRPNGNALYAGQDCSQPSGIWNWALLQVAETPLSMRGRQSSTGRVGLRYTYELGSPTTNFRVALSAVPAVAFTCPRARAYVFTICPPSPNPTTDTCFSAGNAPPASASSSWSTTSNEVVNPEGTAPAELTAPFCHPPAPQNRELESLPDAAFTHDAALGYLPPPTTAGTSGSGKKGTKRQRPSRSNKSNKPAAAAGAAPPTGARPCRVGVNCRNKLTTCKFTH